MNKIKMNKPTKKCENKVYNCNSASFTFRDLKSWVCTKEYVTGNDEIHFTDISTFLDSRSKNKERFLGSIFKTKRWVLEFASRQQE
jgi:hypothetical protein